MDRDTNKDDVGPDRLGEPIIDPAPNRPRALRDGPAIKAATKGATWGAVAGLVAAKLYLSAHSPLGFYGGDAGVMVITWTGVGAILGAAAGWLIQKKSR